MLPLHSLVTIAEVLLVLFLDDYLGHCGLLYLVYIGMTQLR